MSRSLLRSALELRSPITRLPPTFLLPIRARWLSSTPQHTEPSVVSPPPPRTPQSLETSRSQQTSSSIHAKTTTTTTTPLSSSSSLPTEAILSAVHANTPKPRGPSTTPPAPQFTGPVPQSVKDLLPFLRAQPSHYITLHVHGRPYLVTPGDTIRLPFLMPGVQPGDVLRLNRASVLGSRDFTLLPTNAGERKEGSNEVAYIDERLYECRATVVGVASEPMRLKEKTKRRNRKVKTVRSKHRYTVLSISELKIKAPEEIEE
ncbi:Homocitrate dehydratase, mitochondrial [Cytospora mali]|uniref:Large ribosomal subunit protein bL21m n=1 Tax=Cytospora mali TaxID=578113 RepID=A0A194VPV3_CYTMA|nr:Homocitrate dehydratase, mitochondrial [Valsa mali]